MLQRLCPVQEARRAGGGVEWRLYVTGRKEARHGFRTDEEQRYWREEGKEGGMERTKEGGKNGRKEGGRVETKEGKKE